MNQRDALDGGRWHLSPLLCNKTLALSHAVGRELISPSLFAFLPPIPFGMTSWLFDPKRSILVSKQMRSKPDED
jgi:hypothetical protein